MAECCCLCCTATLQAAGPWPHSCMTVCKATQLPAILSVIRHAGTFVGTSRALSSGLSLTAYPLKAASSSTTMSAVDGCVVHVDRELGELLSDAMEDVHGAHEAWGTGERHIKHLRSRPTYKVRDAVAKLSKLTCHPLRNSAGHQHVSYLSQEDHGPINQGGFVCRRGIMGSVKHRAGLP